MARPAMLSFRDVVVTPFTDLLNLPAGGKLYRGGPRWPEWSTQSVARHCRLGKPVDTEPLAAEPTATLTGPVAWGGPIHWHFGHQIADFSTRLLPTLAEMPDARFAFAVRDTAKDRVSSWEATPATFRGILDWFGIDRDRAHIVTEPTLVKRLVVAPQAEQYYQPGPEPWYLDLLDEHTTSRFGEVEPSGSLYVSRAGQSARFAGEGFLETALEDSGIRVLRPETVSIEEQLRAYAGAESIFFAGGSAAHGTQLMGRALGDVTILPRRTGPGPGDPARGRLKYGLTPVVAQSLVKPRARSLRYVNVVRDVVHGLNARGMPALYCALSILDPELLLAVLPMRSTWDQKAFDAAVETDVENWVEAERARQDTVPGSPETVSKTLRAAGLAHLA